jgi:hypothetical protein
LIAQPQPDAEPPAINLLSAQWTVYKSCGARHFRDRSASGKNCFTLRQKIANINPGCITEYVFAQAVSCYYFDQIPHGIFYKTTSCMYPLIWYLFNFISM